MQISKAAPVSMQYFACTAEIFQSQLTHFESVSKINPNKHSWISRAVDNPIVKEVSVLPGIMKRPLPFPRHISLFPLHFLSMPNVLSAQCCQKRDVSYPRSASKVEQLLLWPRTETMW